MKIAVLGAGAVGLSIAGKLSTVSRIHAVCRKKHVEAIAERGFQMTGIWGDGVYRFSSAEHLLPEDAYDFVIITSKSQDTRAICEQFADVIARSDTVSLQNGIGNEEIIAEFTDHVIGGMIITGFEWQGDARVHVSVEAGPIKLGRFPGGSNGRARDLVNIFRAAGMNVEMSENIRGDLWGKTLYNCALNPLGAIMNVPYGGLSDPSAWKIIEEIVREVFVVCEREEVQLAWQTPEEYLTYLKEVQLPATALHHSSMLQDIHRGRRTEIDFINGAVVSRAERYGIDTPVNRTITRLIKFRETLAER